MEFKLRYPDVYEDYVGRCKAREVKPGEPYLYRRPDGFHVLNFPTKNSWRLPARMKWITSGLDRIASNCDRWGIESLALPKLGSSHGGLPWGKVKQEIVSRLSNSPIRIVISLDALPHPQGLESAILRLVNSGDVGRLKQVGVPPAAAASIVARAPFGRAREILELTGVGTVSYARLFEGLAMARARSLAAQTTLEFENGE